MKMKKIIIIFSFLFLIVLLRYFLRLGCVVQRIAHIPCPACGMTRALISFLKMDLNSYFYYNAFAVPVTFSVAFLLCDTKKFKAMKFISIIIIFLNFFYYLYRLFFNLIP